MTFIIIPAYNEERTIAEVVRRSAKYGEVLVVDDGSTDKTAEAAASAGARVLSLPHAGKGAAMKKGLESAKDDVVFIDGDLQHLPEDIPKLLNKLKEADVVIGARRRNGKMPLHRKFSNWASTSAINWATGFSLSDSQSGFRAIGKNAIDALKFDSDGFEVESEMIFAAAKAGLDVTEAPINTIYDGRDSHFDLIKDGKAVISTIWKVVNARRN